MRASQSRRICHRCPPATGTTTNAPPDSRTSCSVRNAPTCSGNTMNCPEGSIPMRRVTLEDMTRFATVRDFMRKSPLGSADRREEDEPGDSPGHPPVGARVPERRQRRRAQLPWPLVPSDRGQSGLLTFPALVRRREWCEPGDGRVPGLQVYPAPLWRLPPVLTCLPTGQPTTTCLDRLLQPVRAPRSCRSAPTFAPGGALPPGQRQRRGTVRNELAYWLANGRWYLYFNGTQGSNVIGYYPVPSLYRGGALATQSRPRSTTAARPRGPPASRPWAAAPSPTRAGTGRLPSRGRRTGPAWRSHDQRKPDRVPGMAGLLHGPDFSCTRPMVETLWFGRSGGTRRGWMEDRSTCESRCGALRRSRGPRARGRGGGGGPRDRLHH